MSLLAQVADLLTSSELNASLVLKTLATEPRATQCALRHRAHLQLGLLTPSFVYVGM